MHLQPRRQPYQVGIKRGLARRVKEVIALFCSALVRLYLQYFIQAYGVFGTGTEESHKDDQKYHIHTSFKYAQERHLHYFSRQIFPMLDSPLCEGILSKIQSKPPLVQFETVPTCPNMCHLRKETNFTPPFQVFVE